MLAHLRRHLIVKAIAHVHSQHESLDFKRGIKTTLYDLDRVEQLAQTLQRQVFALYGNKHRVGRRKDIHGGVAQRWRAVDKDVVEIVAYGLQHVLDYVVAILHLGQLRVGSNKIDARRQHPELLYVGALQNHLLGTFFAYQTLVNAVKLDIEAQSRCGICLRISVEQENFLAQKSQRCGQIYSGGGLSYSTFLVC